MLYKISYQNQNIDLQACVIYNFKIKIYVFFYTKFQLAGEKILNFNAFQLL
jgi:hypothetical protein